LSSSGRRSEREVLLYGRHVPVKVVPENAVPRRFVGKSRQLLELAKTIPRGQGYMFAKEDLPVSISGIKQMINKFKKTGDLSPNFYAVRRIIDDKEILYIINGEEEN
jgi:hypothetical protein